MSMTTLLTSVVFASEIASRRRLGVAALHDVKYIARTAGSSPRDQMEGPVWVEAISAPSTGADTRSAHGESAGKLTWTPISTASAAVTMMATRTPSARSSRIGPAYVGDGWTGRCSAAR